MKRKEELTEAELKDLPKTALARKYKCSSQYVGQVLRGERGNTRSYLADCIQSDANKILEILKPKL